jgi:tetratricopeptide (TPR) repeat protein
MAQKKLHFETLQLHVGQENPDPATGSRAVPIYQTASYVFNNAQHAADRFGLRDAGNIYGRLTNTTQSVFEERVAALEGGVAGLAVASGAAAITYALQNIARNGDHIIAADNLYGGSYNLITHTLSTQGVDYTIVDFSNFDAIEKAIKPNTKAIYAETLGNPNSDVLDIDKTNPEALMYRAYIYMKRRQYQEARLDYRSYLEIKPGDKNARLGMALVNQKAGRFQEALEEFNRLIVDFPEDISLLKGRAELEVEMNTLDLALLDLENASKLTPNDPEIYVMCGDIYLLQGKNREAYVAFEKAIKLGVPRPQLHARLKASKK